VCAVKVSLSRKKASFGFTLPELLISLLVIAEIATFTIPKIITSQQNNRYNAAAKEAMASVASAYQLYSFNNTLSASTTPGDILFPYLNYLNTDTTTTVDQSYTYATSACGTGIDVCYRLHNGGILKGYATANFAGTTSGNRLWFLFDPDATTDGTTNNSGKSLLIILFYNGRVSTYSSVYNITSDPLWFSL
jgi:prepilin-type N-terminal cleavage/methylation domain-containing protein